jgi:hypothetical protein
MPGKKDIQPLTGFEWLNREGARPRWTWCGQKFK